MVNNCIKHTTVNIYVPTCSPACTPVMSKSTARYDAGERAVLNMWRQAYITAKTTAERKQVFVEAAAKLFNYWVNQMKTAEEKAKGFSNEEKQRRETVSGIVQHMELRCELIVQCVGASRVDTQQLAWQEPSQKGRRRCRPASAGWLSDSITKDGVLQGAHYTARKSVSGDRSA